MKPNFKITLLSITAISLTSGLVFAATQQNPASQAYVNAEDISVEKAIVAKGGTVPSSADTCRKLGYGTGTPASIAYVNECDQELYEAIEAIPSVSPFSVGEILCGDTHPYTCPASNSEPWGIVIYADPNPTISGYYGVAMSVEDVIPGDNGSNPAGTPWANNALYYTQINANNYGIYGGINGTFNNYLGQATSGNTQIFCNNANNPLNDCAAPTVPGTTSAFNACAQYSNGPSLAGGWYLPSIAEATQMFTYAQNQPLPTATGVETFNSYFYWSSTEWSGSTNAASNGNLGFGARGGNPADTAFYFDFLDGIQADGPKYNYTQGVRCAQALPI
jgi:hypothetical protein